MSTVIRLANLLELGGLGEEFVPDVRDQGSAEVLIHAVVLVVFSRTYRAVNLDTPIVAKYFLV